MKVFNTRARITWVAILIVGLLMAVVQGAPPPNGGAVAQQKPAPHTEGAGIRSGNIQGPRGSGAGSNQAGFLDIDNDVFDIEDMNGGARGGGFPPMETGYPMGPMGPMGSPAIGMSMEEEEAAAAAEAAEMRALTKKKGGYGNYGSMGYQPFYYPQPMMSYAAMPAPMYYTAPQVAYRPPTYSYYPQSYRCSSCY